MPPGAGQPAINLPPATAWLIGIMVAIHGLRSLLPPEANAWILANLAFVPGYYLLPPPLSWQEIIAPLSHQFLHGGWGHLAVNGLALAAFGSGVERLAGARRTVLFFLASGLAGALAQWAADPAALIPMVGASGGISGLFGAALRLLSGGGPAPGRVRILPVAAIWIVINVVFGLTGGVEGESIAWIAHLGGFAFGLAAFPLLRRRAP
ncbi:MAG: rhomboid family intramembrane serine protease [Rhodospirillaceae bacterium]|jgi:membrane associated rhomboid family serine protease|nr:rhomboid family intramembrane serine protease [Rhodospirillaceae bacterium]